MVPSVGTPSNDAHATGVVPMGQSQGLSVRLLIITRVRGRIFTARHPPEGLAQGRIPGSFGQAASTSKKCLCGHAMSAYAFDCHRDHVPHFKQCE
jgi:hypothetical protein